MEPGAASPGGQFVRWGPFLSVAQAAEHRGLSRYATYRLIRSGKLPAARGFRKLRVDLRELDLWRRGRGEAAAGPIAPATR
jgi:excisionase family DNA binding protein